MNKSRLIRLGTREALDLVRCGIRHKWVLQEHRDPRDNERCNCGKFRFIERAEEYEVIRPLSANATPN